MKIIKAVVDELPESCFSCKFSSEPFSGVGGCIITNKQFTRDCFSERLDDCPLSLEDKVEAVV